MPQEKPTSLVPVQRDEELGTALSSLDPVAWRQLFDEHFDAVYHYAQLKTGSQAVAGDVASATLAAVAKHGTDFGKHRHGYVSRLFDTADRAIAQEHARARSEGRNGQHHDAIANAIGALNGEQRDVIVLRLVEGHDAQRVASQLHIQPRAVASRQMRALHHLCRDHGGLPSDGARAETTLDTWIDRLVRGEPLEDVLGTPGARSLDLLPILRIANAIVRLPRDPVPGDLRERARNAMLREVEASRFRNARPTPFTASPAASAIQEQRSEPEHVASREAQPRRQRVPRLRPGTMPAVGRVPRRAVLAAIAAITVGALVFAGVMYGGDGSRPVLDSLSGPELPHPATLLRGRVLVHDGDDLWVSQGSEPQVVKITPDTQILRGDSPGTLDGARRGATAEALGTLQLNGDFDAVVVRVRDGSAASAAAAPPP